VDRAGRWQKVSPAQLALLRVWRQQFLDAFRGLAPWDAFKNPAYLDRLLVSPAKKPTTRIVLSKARLH
jgi:hypothetical protein